MSFCLAGPALAEQAQSIFIEGDMVRGNTPKGQTGPTCVLNSQAVARRVWRKAAPHPRRLASYR